VGADGAVPAWRTRSDIWPARAATAPEAAFAKLSEQAAEIVKVHWQEISAAA
jgi:hypothetical protein